MVEVTPIAPPVADAAAAAEVATTDGRKGPPTKTAYPGLAVNEKGKATVKLEKVPGDFDASKHSALRRADFKDETVWLEMKATNCEAQAVAYRKEVEMLRKLGDSTTRAKAKSLVAMQAKMAELRKQLAAVGIDPDSL